MFCMLNAVIVRKIYIILDIYNTRDTEEVFVA